MQPDIQSINDPDQRQGVTGEPIGVREQAWLPRPAGEINIQAMKAARFRTVSDKTGWRMGSPFLIGWLAGPKFRRKPARRRSAGGAESPASNQASVIEASMAGYGSAEVGLWDSAVVS
jgi:hypothetical protein